MKKSTVKRLASLFLAMVMLVGAIVVEPSTVTAATKSSIKLNQTKKTIYVGEYTTVTVVKTKDGKTTGFETKSVTYKTSNKKIATVTSKGVVKGIKAGKATITVTSKSNSKVKAKFAVTVKSYPKTGDNARALTKSDFDISGFTGGGITDEATGKLYTNYIDYYTATKSKDEYIVFYDDGSNEDCYTDANPKTFTTPRGIKLGSSKKTELKKYPECFRDMSYKDKNQNKQILNMLHKNWDTKGHTVKDYVIYNFKYKNDFHSINFIIDQNNKVMCILYE